MKYGTKSAVGVWKEGLGLPAGVGWLGLPAGIGRWLAGWVVVSNWEIVISDWWIGDRLEVRDWKLEVRG